MPGTTQTTVIRADLEHLEDLAHLFDAYRGAQALYESLGYVRDEEFYFYELTL